MTNAYDGGALSRLYLSVVLAATVVPSQFVRIVSARDVVFADGRPCFPAQGGRANATSAQFADLWDACMLGAEVDALSQSTATVPPMRLGPASRMCSSRGGAFARYVFNKDFVCQPSAGDRQPNRIRFKFPAAVEVALRAEVAAPAHGDYAVLDAAVYLDHAEGAMVDDGTCATPPRSAEDYGFMFLNEANAMKYAEFCRLRVAAPGDGLA